MPRPLKLALGLMLLALLVVVLDAKQALATLANAQQDWVVAAFLLSVASVLLSAGKWHGLLRRGRVGVPFPLVARLYWIGCFFGNFLPTGVGGDAVRLALTPARQGATGRVAGSILIERLTGLLALVVLCIPGLLFYRLPNTALYHALLLLVVGLAVSIGLALLAPAFLARLAALARQRTSRAQGLLGQVERLAAVLAEQISDRSALANALLLSLPFYGLVLFAQYCLLQAVGADVAPIETALLGPLAALLALVPISVNGLGIAEAAFVAVYAAAGVPAEVALAAALLRRLVDLANSGLGGLCWLERGAAGHGQSSAVRPRAAAESFWVPAGRWCVEAGGRAVASVGRRFR